MKDWKMIRMDIFLPPPKPRLHELFIKSAAEQAGVTVIPSRLSILTKKIKSTTDDEVPVFFAHNAIAIAVWQKQISLLPMCLIYPALKTGNVDVVANAMAREVLTNNEGLATGVSYINKEDMQEYQVTGKVVILAASACESCKTYY